MQQSECEVVVKERKKERMWQQTKERKKTNKRERKCHSGFAEKYSAVVQELKRLLEHWQRNQDQKKDLTATIVVVVVVYLCVETGSGMME